MSSEGLDSGGPTETLVREGGSLKLRLRTVRLEVLAGPDVGRAWDLGGTRLRIGSAPGCDMVLNDPTVSRHHATVHVVGAVRIADEGSRNGTILDGVRIREAYARADSTIALGNTRLRLRVLDGTVDVPLSERERFGRLLGRSAGMRQVFGLLEQVAPTDATVLVEGETGTGKELVAEAVHEHSSRAGGPFIVFDCSAVPSNLIESELFGHVKGAFTGAMGDRVGAFEAAHGGTLFLDELGELPLDLQPKLLRALEQRQIKRLGDNVVRAVDARIIAATNRSLQVEVERGAFREDLYYRLAVICVTLPPLRERPDDIPLLVEHFCQLLALPAGTGAQVLPATTVRAFQAQAWPGNTRELRNAVERALSLGQLGSVPPYDAAGAPAALPVDLGVPLRLAKEQLIERFETSYLREALRKTGGNVSRAAALAGVDRKFIQRAAKRYGLWEDE